MTVTLKNINGKQYDLGDNWTKSEVKVLKEIFNPQETPEWYIITEEDEQWQDFLSQLLEGYSEDMQNFLSHTEDEEYAEMIAKYEEMEENKFDSISEDFKY